MELNPYQAPEATVAEVEHHDDLAERGTRLGAAIIDGLILTAIWAPVMFATGYFQKALARTLGFGTILAYTFGAFVVFVLIQSYPLAKHGQTWGKRMLSIRIATLDGGKPTLGTLLLRRYFPVQFVNVVPGVGGLLGLVNLLFIFRADRRCMHDLIAGTKVVKT